MHIGVFGISGTGKTTLTKLFLQRNPDYIGTSASSLIANVGNEINYQHLNQNKASRNQEILIDQYNKFKEENKKSIIELHNLIELDNGIFWIPPEVLINLNIDLIFFLYTDPHEILNRRISDKSKSRKIVTPNELKKIQDLSLEKLISTFGKENIHILSGENSVLQLINFLDSTHEESDGPLN